MRRRTAKESGNATGANGRHDVAHFSLGVVPTLVYVQEVVRVHRRRQRGTEESNGTERDVAWGGLMRLPRTWPNVSATRSPCRNILYAIFRSSDVFLPPSLLPPPSHTLLLSIAFYVTVEGSPCLSTQKNFHITRTVLNEQLADGTLTGITSRINETFGMLS